MPHASLPSDHARGGSPPEPAAPPLIFGVTLAQVDQLDRLIAAIAAQGDAISIGLTGLDERSLPALGGAIYDAANAMGCIVDRFGEQPLAQAAETAVAGVRQAVRPAFANAIYDSLRQARSIVQVAEVAACGADGAEGLGGACRAASDLLSQAIAYVETHFDTSPREARPGR